MDSVELSFIDAKSVESRLIEEGTVVGTRRGVE